MIKSEDLEWSNSCEFIDRLLWFCSFDDFCNNAIKIKTIYSNAEDRTKKLYRWYVYSRFITYKQKCDIWDYLNGDITLLKLKSNNLQIRTKKLNDKNKYSGINRNELNN